MTDLFGIEGQDLDRGYMNLREGKYTVERELRSQLQKLWEQYEPYADPNFREGFARDPDGRFWEMYLGCTLLNAGKKLLPAAERRKAGGQRTCVCSMDLVRFGSRRLHPTVGKTARTKLEDQNRLMREVASRPCLYARRSSE